MTEQMARCERSMSDGQQNGVVYKRVDSSGVSSMCIQR